MYYSMTSDPADDHGVDYDALAARVQHSADALAPQTEVSRSVPTLAGRRKSQDKVCCCHCNQDATHTDSVLSRETSGYNLSESGYKTIYLCAFHAREAQQDNTSRVQHSADALAQQDADYAEGCMPDPNAEGDF